jgi:transcription elongation factor Elf1
MASKITVDDNGFIVSVEPASKEALGPTVRKRSRTRTNSEKTPTTRNLKQRQRNLKTRSVSSKDKSMVTCTFCNSQVRADRLSKHISNIHPDKKLPPDTKRHTTASDKTRPRKLSPRDMSPTQKLSNKPFVRCSICEQNIRSDKWEKHLKKVHAASVTNKVSKSSSKSRNTAPKSPRTSRKSGGGGIDPDVRRRALKELHEETSYGDKYLGQVRREADGRFGSIPLYDDYSEESGA